MRKALNDVVVQRLKPKAREYEIVDLALPGFAVVVQPSGTRSFVLRYRIGGDRRKKKLSLGRYGVVSLADARGKARKALRMLTDGIDPAAAMRAAADASSRNRFSDVVAEFVEKYARVHNRTWRETERLLTTGDLAGWQGRGVAIIGRRDVLDVLDAITARGAPVQANRLFATLRRFFAWSVERGIVDASPMAGLKPPSPEKSRTRVLSDDELRAVWLAADAMGFPFGKAVQMMILSAARRSEVLGAAWDEFDFTERVWTLPRERSKNDVALVAPLSDAVVALLDSLPRIGSKLFIGRTGKTAFSGVSKATIRLNALALKELRKGDPKASLPPWRLHDIRRTAASGLARLGTPVFVTEKLLNHVAGSATGGKLVAIYQRHDYFEERRHAIQSWGAHVSRLVSGESGTNVLPMTKRTRTTAKV